MKIRGLSFGDRLFWSIMIFLGTGLLWLKFFDPITGMWPALPAGLAVVGSFLYLARPEEDEPIDFEASKQKP